MARKDYPETPDGRYFVSKGRLWRKTDPALDDSTRRKAIKALMQARRTIGQSDDDAVIAAARKDVAAAKETLGERGPVWWDDGAPDEGGRHPKNSSYSDWWAALPPEMRVKGDPD